MDVIECIKTRRSIRKFKNETVSAEKLAEIVNIAAYAPSWKNSQTTRYIAVLDKSLKDRLANECMMGFEYNIGTASAAPAGTLQPSATSITIEPKIRISSFKRPQALP
jgi:nitroreductase